MIPTGYLVLAFALACTFGGLIGATTSAYVNEKRTAAASVTEGSKWLGRGSDGYASVWHVEAVSPFRDYCAIRLEGSKRVLCVPTTVITSNMKPVPESEASA